MLIEWMARVEADATRGVRAQPYLMKPVVIRAGTACADDGTRRINESLIKSHTQLWAVSLQKGALKNARRDVVLNTLVRNAGGTREYIVAQSAVPMQLARIADALTSQYEITYQRPGGEAKIVQVGHLTGRDLKLVTGIFAPK